jgi:hypothetical protein
VHCIDSGKKLGALALAGVLAGCAPPRSSAPVGPPAPPDVGTPSPGVKPVPLPQAAQRPRNWDEYRVQAGLRLVEANPDRSYVGEVPEPLLAIPVLEVELNGNGSVRRIVVLRHPSQANDTVQLAIDAVQRAGPYGDVSHLPRPWKFSEVFLFRDDRRFKPRSLDQ